MTANHASSEGCSKNAFKPSIQVYAAPRSQVISALSASSSIAQLLLTILVSVVITWVSISVGTELFSDSLTRMAIWGSNFVPHSTLSQAALIGDITRSLFTCIIVSVALRVCSRPRRTIRVTHSSKSFAVMLFAIGVVTLCNRVAWAHASLDAETEWAHMCIAHLGGKHQLGSDFMVFSLRGTMAFAAGMLIGVFVFSHRSLSILRTTSLNQTFPIRIQYGIERTIRLIDALLRNKGIDDDSAQRVELSRQDRQLILSCFEGYLAGERAWILREVEAQLAIQGIHDACVR